MSIKTNIKNKIAFTIAEFLIAIGIIGIIAAIMLPILLGNVMQSAFNQEQDLIVKKLRASTDLMRVNSSLMGYATNDSFVDEFQKYIKISKRCDLSNLKDCFISSFQNASGDTIKLSNLSTGGTLGQSSNNSNLVGLVLINGTTMVLAYNPNCTVSQNTNAFVDTTSCIAMVYDVNGFAQPNKIGKDISLLNAAITSCDGIYLSGICIAPSDLTYDPYDWGVEGLDYWEGATDACGNLGMRLPTRSELSTIIYPNKSRISGLTSGAYWAIDGANMYTAYYINMSNGGSQNSMKVNNCSARCVK